jgi:hypothetical protein
MLRLLEWLFPPQLGRVDDLKGSLEYQGRLGRTGVDRHMVEGSPISWGVRIVRISEYEHVLEEPQERTATVGGITYTRTVAPEVLLGTRVAGK